MIPHIEFRFVDGRIFATVDGVDIDVTKDVGDVFDKRLDYLLGLDIYGTVSHEELSRIIKERRDADEALDSAGD